jgi:AraC family transcriptional regulator
VAASDIKLIDVSSGKPFPAAPAASLLMSSVPLGWRGIVVELHRLPPQELPEHYVVGHGLSISTAARPIRFGWRGGKGWRDSSMNPGEFHLLASGDLNCPRWRDTFEEASIVLDRGFVADVVRDGTLRDRIEFMTQRSASDPIIVGYAHRFLSELANESANGLLYADTLAVGYALHLLANYAVARPKLPAPRGKLNSFQLRSVVDFIQSNLDERVSLLALAERANVSPFHFTRQFRATVGVPPHQFVLRQRIPKTLSLLKARETCHWRRSRSSAGS